jgi:hypothetical protein
VQISLVRISLLRFFKTFQKNLANAFLWLFISLLRFSYLAIAFLGLFFSLLRFLYLANAILGLFISLLRF